jgi:hypothetical protein
MDSFSVFEISLFLEMLELVRSTFVQVLLHSLFREARLEFWLSSLSLSPLVFLFLQMILC